MLLYKSKLYFLCVVMLPGENNRNLFVKSEVQPGDNKDQSESKSLWLYSERSLQRVTLTYCSFFHILEYVKGFPNVIISHSYDVNSKKYVFTRDVQSILVGRM